MGNPPDYLEVLCGGLDDQPKVHRGGWMAAEGSEGMRKDASGFDATPQIVSVKL